MKVLKLRIAETHRPNIGIVYFPQAQVRYLYFFKVWKRIARHPHNSFGLYDNIDISTDSWKEAFEMIYDFKDWYEMINSKLEFSLEQSIV